MKLRKCAKAFLVAFVVAAMFDACAKYFNLFLTQLQSINDSVSYGLSSVNISSLAGVFSTRLQGDRYHVSILDVRSPFNLSDACRHPEQTSARVVVQELCRNRATPAIDTARWHDFTQSFQQSVYGPGPLVDEQKYPRSKLEYLIGIPDATIHSLVCAWRGREACSAQPFPTAVPRSNWFGKLILLVTFALAAGATVVQITESRRRSAKPNKVLLAFLLLPVRLLIALIVVGLVSLVALLILTPLTRAGLLLSGVVCSMATLTITRLLLEAAKDLISDRIKKPLLEENQ